MVTSSASGPQVAPSPLASFISKHSGGIQQGEPALALQVAHNLRYQHNWTDLRLHQPAAEGQDTFSRCLVSGYPPQRLYVHPDEQIELLQKQKDSGGTGMPNLPPEREWVLPSRLREKWSLRRFGDAFDAISTTPRDNEGGPIFEKAAGIPLHDDDQEQTTVHPALSNRLDLGASSGWRDRLPKRILLATVDDDSTVVYYIVHDGIVKPRQN